MGPFIKGNSIASYMKVAIHQELLKFFAGCSGPNCQAARFAQGLFTDLDAGPGVELIIPLVGHRAGTIIHIQQNRIKALGSTCQQRKDIAGDDLGAFILQGLAVKLSQMLTIPIDDRGQ